MNQELVKILVDEDGNDVPSEEQQWCLADPSPYADTARVLCSQQALDHDTNAKWASKLVKRGGITCPKCIETVKAFKAIKF